MTTFLILQPLVFIYSQLIHSVRVSKCVDDFNTHNKALIAKLLKQGYRFYIIIFEKRFQNSIDFISMT